MGISSGHTWAAPRGHAQGCQTPPVVVLVASFGPLMRVGAEGHLRERSAAAARRSARAGVAGTARERDWCGGGQCHCPHDKAGHTYTRHTHTDESLPRGGFIPAETLVLAGDNGTTG